MPKKNLEPVDYSHIADRAACMEVMITNYLVSYPELNDKALIHDARIAISALQSLHEAAVAKGSADTNTLHDRASWLCDSVSDLLVEHPTIKSDNKAHKSAHSAMARLWTLYQYLSTKWFNKNSTSIPTTE